jgi:hypothetical protein
MPDRVAAMAALIFLWGSLMAFLYKCTPTGKLVHESDAFVKMVMGPFGSGKSTIMAEDMLIYAMAQAPDADGVRSTRWGVIRASYPNLNATRRTILEIMPGHSGDITTGNAPWHGAFRFALGDGTQVLMETDLWSSLTGDDAKKFRSFNWTGCWINEATEVSSDVMFAASDRVGRYPAGRCTWSGILMDFNRPPKGHWLLSYFGKPSIGIGRDVFRLDSFTQPPAAFRREADDGRIYYEVNPEAENLENLDGGTDYYAKQIALREVEGKTAEIESLYCLLDVDTRDGKPVFPTFRREAHVSRGRLEPMYHRPVTVGFDSSGIHPAAVVLQLQDFHWCVIDELAGIEMGLEVFMEALKDLLRERYRFCESVTVSCDPANARDSYTGLSPAKHLRDQGFEVYLPGTNNPDTRIAAVATLLNKNHGGLLVSPHCERTIAALAGDYRYRRHRMLGSVQAVYSPRPEKNEASHIADALQYAALCLGRGTDAPGHADVVAAVAKANAARRTILGAA